MSSLLIYWICIAVVFLIIEMVTTTFYGLALAIAAGATTLYVWISGAVEVDVVQGVIFVLVSLFASYFLPRILTSSTPDKPQGLDIYIGETRKVKKIGDTYKISLDGVDYPIDRDDVAVGDTVKIYDRKGSVFHVDIID